jgi:hypothetical protein
MHFFVIVVTVAFVVAFAIIVFVNVVVVLVVIVVLNLWNVWVPCKLTLLFPPNLIYFLLYFDFDT